MDYNPEMQNVARWLLAYEAEHENPSGAAKQLAVRVCDKLHEPLSTLAGVDGYKALISRALALARVKAPSLGSLRVREDGSLEALKARPQQDPDDTRNGDAALVAQLLGLLATFIGEALTLQLVRDIWPDAPSRGISSETENL
jgi:hypothetical protein